MKPGSPRANSLNPLRRGGWGNQANMERAFLGHWKIFLGRKVENQKAIHASFPCRAMETLESELKDWVQVSVKNDRNLGLSANFADAIKNTGNGGARLQGPLRGQLVDQAIGEWIGEGDAELDNVGACLFQRESEIDGGRQRGSPAQM